MDQSIEPRQEPTEQELDQAIAMLQALFDLACAVIETDQAMTDQSRETD